MRRPLCFLCLLFVLTLAAFRVIEPPPIIELGELSGQEVNISGKVARKEVKNNCIVLYLKQVVIQGVSPYQSTKPSRIGALCYLKAGQNAVIGSTVVLSGWANDFSKATNTGAFDVRKYYALSGIHFNMRSVDVLKTSDAYCPYREMLFDIKCYLVAAFNRYLTEENAAIMRAIMLGDKSSMDNTIKDMYRSAGIAHILAISGLHISLIGMGLYRLLKLLGMNRWFTIAISLFFIVSYGNMVGFAPSVYRAIGMFILVIIGENLNRSYDLLSALSLMAVLLLMMQPEYLYYGGFQLSFAAIMGIGMIYPSLMEEHKERSSPKWKKSLYGSLSVFLATLPVVVYHYCEISLYAMLWNVVVIPLLTLLVISGMLLLTISGIPYISVLTAVPAWLCEKILFFYKILTIVNQYIPFSVLSVQKPQIWQLSVYIVLVLVSVFFGNKQRRQAQVFFICIAVTLLILPMPQRFSLTFFDVGQGDGACVITPSGRVCLIDCGSLDRINTFENAVMPLLKQSGIKSVDYWILTHPDKDHISAFTEVVQSNPMPIRIHSLVLPKAGENDIKTREIAKLAEEKGIDILWMGSGDCISEGKLEFSCLYPDSNEKTQSANDLSLVLMMKYKNLNVLFTGDAGDLWEKRAESVMQKPVTILKVSHHGSAENANSEAFINVISPRVAVISCGADNRFGHPHKETLSRLSDVNATVIRTDISGAVTVHISYGLQKEANGGINIVERICVNEYNE